MRDLSQFLAENGPDETDHRYEPAGKFQVDFNYLVLPAQMAVYRNLCVITITLDFSLERKFEFFWLI